MIMYKDFPLNWFFFSNNFRKFKKFVDSKTDLLLYVKRELKLINSI